ncbi:MAG: lamin tail domain-containing protein [bacterium]
MKIKSFFLTLFLIFSFDCSFVRADSQNVNLIGKLAGGLPRDVSVSGNYAYVAAEGLLSIVDISDPANPQEVSYYDTPGTAYGVYVSGDYAYVADSGSGLRIIDISNPSSPSETGYYDTPGSACGVYVSGGYAFVADGSSGLRIIDISNPAAPSEIGFYDTPDYARGVYVSGDYAYVVDTSSGLRVIDISTPASPSETGYYETQGSARGVYVSGGYAYVADYDSGLRIIDISTPASPSETGYYNTPGYAYGVYVSGGYAYVADSGSGLRIINISTPASPSQTGYYNTSGSAYGVYVSGGYAYVADYRSGLRIINITTPASPTETGYYDTPGYAYGVSVSGNYAYVADGSCGLGIIDISNPSSPSETSYYDPGSAYGVYISGNYAYVAGSNSGLRIIDILNPASPSETGFYDTPGYAYGVFVSGTYAYVADRDSGLRIINVLNPSSPSEVGFYDTPGSAYGIYVSEGYAYVADWDSGLRIIDISNPASPSEVGYYDTSGYARGVFVSGVYAYVADYHFGLRIIDISNPAAPSEVGFYNTPGYAYGVSVSGNYAYVADSGYGLRIIDISNPASPSEVGYYDTPGYAYGISVSGNYACVADYNSGLWIFEADSTPPASVTDLTALSGEGNSDVKLVWTAAGDNGTTGNITNGQYCIKYSTNSGDGWSSLNYVQWSTDTVPGSIENKIIGGLAGNNTYYFWLKTYDDLWSDISNGATFYVLPDVAEPDAVTDLAGEPGVSVGSMNLTWTAPGDDGTSGDIAGGAYQLKYSTSPADGWESSYSVLWSTDTSPGNIESRTVTPLEPGGTYYFWIKTRDDTEHWSEISNGATSYAKPQLNPPISENWDSGTIDSSKWIVTSGNPSINTAGVSEPSGIYSLNLDGEGDEITLQRTDLSGHTTGYVMFYWQRGGNGESPDSSDYLKLEVYLTTGWQEVFSIAGNSSNDSVFTSTTIALSTTAFHQDFQLRFRSNGSGANFDDFFVDDVVLSTVTYSISGSVKDGGGNGITGAEVYLSGTNSDVYTISGAGNYEFTQLSMGAYGVIVSSSGWDFTPSSYTYSLLATNQSARNFTGTTDTTTPAAVTNLAGAPGVSVGSVDLTWTAPGDDETSGDIVGGAYQLKYSTNSSDGWESSYSILWSTNTSPENIESKTITALEPGTTYYFWMKTMDNANNLSEISNGATGYARPRRPPTLSENWDSGTIDLSKWEVTSGNPAVNTDGASEQSGTYSLNLDGEGDELTLQRTDLSGYVAGRISFYWQRGGNGYPPWPGMFLRLEVELPSGWIELWNIEGNDASDSVYISTIIVLPSQAFHQDFRFRFNCSNVGFDIVDFFVDDVTMVIDEVTPPSAISDLTALTGPYNGEITLSWTAPGDDGSAGDNTGGYYTVRFATYSVGDFADNATAWWQSGVSGEKEISVSAGPGGKETAAITGLSVGTTYYFAIRAYDSNDNQSPVDNNAYSSATQARAPASTAGLPPGLPRTVVINEIAYMGTAANIGDEWIELYNTTESAIDISGWSIYGANAGAWLNFSDKDGGTTVISSGSYLIYANHEDDVKSSTGNIVDIRDDTINLNPTSDIIILYDGPNGTGNKIDEVDNNDGSWFVTVAAGYSMERKDPKYDGTTSVNWAVCATRGPETDSEGTKLYGTPGRQNSVYTIFDSTAPAAINDLSALAGTEYGCVNLTWTAVGDDGTTGNNAGGYYAVRFATYSISDFSNDATTWWNENSSNQKTFTEVKGVGQPENKTVDGLTAGDTYYFAVKAYDSSGNESDIDTMALSSTTQARAFAYKPPPDGIAPSAISDLTALTGSNDGEINLIWTAPGDDGTTGTASEYEIKCSSTSNIADETDYDAAQNFSVFSRSPVPQPADAGTEESFTVTGLMPGVTYYFAVKAGDEFPLWSSWSRTGANQNNYAVAYGIGPDSPTGFGAINLTTASITWGWQDTAVNEDGYYIKNDTGGIVADLPADTTYWKESDLTRNTSYYRYAESHNTNGSTASSAVTVYTLANPPDNPAFISVSSNTIFLSWQLNSNPEWTKYGLSGSTDNFVLNFSTFIDISDNFTSTATAITNLSQDTTYWFRVWAYNGNGITTEYKTFGSTKTIRENTAPAAVTDLAAVPGDYSGEIKLFWTSPGTDELKGNLTGKFRIDYSTSLKTWDYANYEIPLSTENCPPLTSFCQTISGLTPAATYYFRMWSCDEVPLWSDISNGATAWARTGVYYISGDKSNLVIFDTSQEIIRLEISTGTFVQDVVLKITKPSFPAVRRPLLGGTTIGCEITVNEGLQPTKPVDITINYDNVNISGFNETTFCLGHYDESLERYTLLPCQKVNKEIGFSTEHFSIFQILQFTQIEDLSTARVYPNPFKPSKGHQYIWFTRLPQNRKVRIKIFNLAMETVFNREVTTDSSGEWAWNVKTNSEKDVASGVYIYLIDDGRSKKSGKLAILR